MRTTIDIPFQDHALFKALAQQRGETLGATLVSLARQALQPSGVGESRAEYRIDIDPATGLPILQGGKRIVTHEEVKKFLEDSE
ncbi:MAG: hypothetical protein IPG63_09290 [Xanthomonadales bacterium]|nr:hypothetical protein [Xanthomonadales bacterium]MBK7144592.1 hypothetical protein [Xanthomonadales bacterium]MCC6561102.1 hypothetical protein [Xanthomonadales bacterium]